MSVKNNKFLQEDYKKWLIDRDLQKCDKGKAYIMWAISDLRNYVSADDIIFNEVMFDDRLQLIMEYFDKMNIKTFCITLKSSSVLDILFYFSHFDFNIVEPYVITRKSDFGDYIVKGIRISKK